MNNLDKNKYKPILDAINNFVSEKGFRFVKDDLIEYYSDDKRAFTIDYDNKGSLINLKYAMLEEGEDVNWKTVSSWLFNEGSNEQDLKSITNDFCDSISELLGEKASTVLSVDMPTKKKNVETVDMENFTARFLTIFPQHKEQYKENVTKYNEFMYDMFFSEFAVNELKDALSKNNKKQITKILNLLSDAFINGDSTVSTTVIYTIMAGILINNNDIEVQLNEYFEKYPYLKRATTNMIKLLKTPKNQKKYL